MPERAKGEKMKKFYMMCGISASGKSTVAREISEIENATIISSDDIRQELWPGERYRSERNAEIFRTLESRLAEMLSAGKNVIIEAIFSDALKRKLYVEQVKSKDYQAVCIYCEKNLNNAIHSNSMRDLAKRVSDGVIIDQYIRFDVPDMSEGWDEIRINDGNKYSEEFEKISKGADT